MADELNTIATPNATSVSVTTNSTRSGRTFLAIGYLPDRLFKNASAVLIVIEHVEARACRGEQNHVAWRAEAQRFLHRVRHRGDKCFRKDAADRIADLARSGADQQHVFDASPHRLHQGRVRSPFVLAAENH